MLELGPKIFKKFGMVFILSNSFFYWGEGKNAFIFKR